jgi:hypothetical protein
MARACDAVRGAMTEVTPFWMREHFDSRHLKRHGKQQLLREITSLSPK